MVSPVSPEPVVGPEPLVGAVAVAGHGSQRTGHRAAAVTLLAVSIACFVVLRTFVVRERFGDLAIYRLEGLQVLHGRDLYARLPGVHGLATYPPFAGIVFTAYAPLRLGVLETLDVVLTLAALVWVAVAACRLAGVRPRAATTVGLLFAAGLLWCEPVYSTFSFGQIDLYLLALVMWDFTRPADSRWRGVGVGLAAGVKVTPAVFVVYLLLTRRWSAALRAIGTLAATLAVSLAVDAHETVRFWTGYLFDTRRVGPLANSANQSLRGVLVRVAHTEHTGAAATLLVLVVGVAGLAVATTAYDRLGERWGLTAAAVTGLLCSPIAWSHHWVWCVPILVLLWFEARGWFAVGVAVFFSFVVWWVPHGDTDGLQLSTPQVLISGFYVLFGVGFLALTAHRSWTSRTLARAAVGSA